MAQHKCDKEKVFTDLYSILAKHGTILERLDRSINGNGQPGLVQKVEDLDKSVAMINASHTQSKWSLRTSLTALSIALVVLFKILGG